MIDPQLQLYQENMCSKPPCRIHQNFCLPHSLVQQLQRGSAIVPMWSRGCTSTPGVNAGRDTRSSNPTFPSVMSSLIKQSTEQIFVNITYQSNSNRRK